MQQTDLAFLFQHLDRDRLLGRLNKLAELVVHFPEVEGAWIKDFDSTMVLPKDKIRYENYAIMVANFLAEVYEYKMNYRTGNEFDTGIRELINLHKNWLERDPINAFMMNGEYGKWIRSYYE